MIRKHMLSGIAIAFAFFVGAAVGPSRRPCSCRTLRRHDQSRSCRADQRRSVKCTDYPSPILPTRLSRGMVRRLRWLSLPLLQLWLSAVRLWLLSTQLRLLSRSYGYYPSYGIIHRMALTGTPGRTMADTIRAITAAIAAASATLGGDFTGAFTGSRHCGADFLVCRSAYRGADILVWPEFALADRNVCPHKSLTAPIGGCLA